MTSPRIITAYRILVWLIALILICLCFEFFSDLIVGGHGKFPQFLNAIMVSGLVIALFILALINRKIDKIRQYIHSREIRQRNRKLATLNNLIIRANQNLDLDDILQAALQETIAALGAEGGMIHLLEEDEDRLIVTTRHGLSERFFATEELTSIPTDIPCKVVATHRSQECFNTGQIPCRFVCAAVADSWQGIVGIPILAKNRLIGVMHVMIRTGREYSADDIRFATTIGRQAGILIEHVRMFTELNWKNEELLRSHNLLERSSHQLALSRNRLKNNLALVERANEELEGLARVKSHFLGMISHEFRTPLTAILGSTEFLIAHHCDVADDETRQLLEMIRKGGARLNEIVTNLMKVARLEAAAPPLARSPLHLQDILAALISQLTPLLAERRQHIVCCDLSALPYFSADREYLEEVFNEILENACKFTPDGGDIAISAQVVDRRLLVEYEAIIRRFNSGFYESMGDKCYILAEVRDSGIGISSADQVKVFDKFYEVGDIRHHSTGKHKFQGKGAGLGLTIVKGMVEAHGGMVWVESRPDRPGSSFSLLLPLEDKTIQPPLPFMQGEDEGSPQKGHD
ncbi:MAG: ATP-binding protein [Geobacteraceae bacterium]